MIPSAAAIRFAIVYVSHEAVALAGSAKKAFEVAMAAKERELVTLGVDPDTIEAVRAWTGHDGMSFSVKYKEPPTAFVIHEWVPTALDRMRGAA